jgi:hypothetical protein
LPQVFTDQNLEYMNKRELQQLEAMKAELEALIAENKRRESSLHYERFEIDEIATAHVYGDDQGFFMSEVHFEGDAELKVFDRSSQMTKLQAKKRCAELYEEYAAIFEQVNAPESNVHPVMQGIIDAHRP